MPLVDLDDLVNRATGGNNGNPYDWFWQKDPRVQGSAGIVTVAGRLSSLWMYEGIPAAGDVPPTSATVPTNATSGSLRQPTTGALRETICTYISAIGSQPGSIILYDRLLHISGLDGTSTSAQTVGGTLTRYTGAASRGNEIWIEIYTQIGTTARNLTVNYTDQDGNSASTVVVVGGTGLREVQRLIKVPFAQDDYGARAVASVQLDVSTGTPGNFGVTVVRPIAQLSIPVAGGGSILSLLDKPLKIQSDACLSLAFFANGTVGPFVTVDGFFVEAAV